MRSTVAGKECPCCHLKYPDEMYRYESAKIRQCRDYTMCIGCRRDCRGRKVCHLGEIDA